MARIRIRVACASLEQAREVRDDIERRFHPAGYDTTLSILQEGERWIVFGSRLSSCD